MQSNHLILCLPLPSCHKSCPASGSFPVSQFFTTGGQNIGASASASVLPMNIQDWFPLGQTGWISMQSKGLSRVFSNPTFQKYQFFSAQFFYDPTFTSIHDYWKSHNFNKTDLCRYSNVAGRGTTFRARTGFLSNTRKWIVKETHVLTKQEILMGKGTHVESSRVREPRRIVLPRGLQYRVLGWWVLVSGLSLANHSYSEPFLVVHASPSQDGCKREGFWEVDWHVMSPFDLSRTLPVGGGLLVPYSLPGPPVIKPLMQMVTKGPGQGGRFQSVCFL